MRDGTSEVGRRMLRLQFPSNWSVSVYILHSRRPDHVCVRPKFALQAIALHHLGVQFEIIMASEISPEVRALMAVTHRYLGTEPSYSPEDP